MLRLSKAGRAAHGRANVAFEAAYSRFVEALPEPEAAKRSLEQIEAAADRALARLAEDSRARTG
jgi:hypothetical protein